MGEQAPIQVTQIIIPMAVVAQIHMVIHMVTIQEVILIHMAIITPMEVVPIEIIHMATVIHMVPIITHMETTIHMVITRMVVILMAAEIQRLVHTESMIIINKEFRMI